jgi:hypothetical protein
MAIKITTTKVVCAMALVALAGWIFFHPRREAQLEELTPAMRDWLRQQPFGTKYDAKIHHATQSSKLTDGNLRWTSILRQSIGVLTPGVLRKTTAYYDVGNSNAMQEEYTRLTMGPLILVSHRRSPLPIAGDLLPYAFWDTKNLRDLVIQRNTGFPDQPNGEFAATYGVDELNTDGSLAQSVSISVQCIVTGVRPASSFLPTLKGDAMLYRCEGKSVKKSGNQVSQSENAYFPDLAWSFAFSETMRDEREGTQKQWQNSLTAID